MQSVTSTRKKDTNFTGKMTSLNYVVSVKMSDLHTGNDIDIYHGSRRGWGFLHWLATSCLHFWLLYRLKAAGGQRSSKDKPCEWKYEAVLLYDWIVLWKRVEWHGRCGITSFVRFNILFDIFERRDKCSVHIKTEIVPRVCARNAHPEFCFCLP